MRKSYLLGCWVAAAAALGACQRTTEAPAPAPFSVRTSRLGTTAGTSFSFAPRTPQFTFSFSAPLLRGQDLSRAISLQAGAGGAVAFRASQPTDTTLLVQPAAALPGLSRYTLTVTSALQSAAGQALSQSAVVSFSTGIDSTAKFARLSTPALLDLVQRQTFRYFWEFGHPVSGLARERNTSGDVVTTGGTGFGVMAMLAAVNRGFITREQARARIALITTFYLTRATAYHGAYAHWLNGATGATIPFSARDDGADLVETAFLMQGLLCARQYFSGADADETALRTAINHLWDSVDWAWFRQPGQNVLTWHWSPTNQFAINQPIQGWNEALVVYALAAAARVPARAIPKVVYDQGWARAGALRNGQSYYGVPLPLGEAGGGPLFYEHYSFLGIDPRGLTDAYASYDTQATAHVRLNQAYCVANPGRYAGYSTACWGLTASDDPSGYAVHSPTADNGTLAPTAAVASVPYDTARCMPALRFFYYTLGDKLWGDYGFKDAFNLQRLWFADSYLAIDQGPQIVMLENARSGLLWQLFMSCPEVKTGLRSLGFQGPSL
jgi:hypothetical protein